MSITLEDRLRAHVPEVMDQLLAEYGHEIQGVAYLILRDRSDAEDVLAETIITAWQQGHRLRDVAAIRPWLLRIATNKSLSHRRNHARLVRLDSAPEGSSADHAGASTNRVALLAGCASLPPQMRAAIALRYYADLSVEEVATALGKSPNTIKAQLQTALARLRVSLIEPTMTLGTGSPHA